MQWRHRRQSVASNVDNVVWLSTDKRDKRTVSQWMSEDFYQMWMSSMEGAFGLLGMCDRFELLQEERLREGVYNCSHAPDLVPVHGWRNRHLLRQATERISDVCPSFKLVRTSEGVALVHDVDKRRALEEWEGLVEILGQTTVVAMVTPGLRFYVKGTQLGYDRETQHLFRRSNTLKHLGEPNNPVWEANISGYPLVLAGDWSVIRKTREKSGHTIFHMLQLNLNWQVREAIKKGT